MTFKGNFLPTGIGSMPFTDPEYAARYTVETFPQIPYWPQLPRVSELESMNTQISQGFPGLRLKDGKLVVVKDQDFFEKAESIMAGAQIGPAAISDSYAAGLGPFLRNVKAAGPVAVKGQMPGPITFGFDLVAEDGTAALEDELLRELALKHVVAKAKWQFDILSRFNVPVLLFLDEPYLSSFGTPFFNWSQERVVSTLKSVFDQVLEYAAASGQGPLYIGSHCCGNTDWPIFPLSGAMIISFDAFLFSEKFLLYREEMTAFLKSGGNLAWGIVPTDPNNLEKTNTEALVERMEAYIRQIQGWGLDPELIAAQSLITPACGLGYQPLDAALKAFKLTVEVSDELRKRFHLT